MFKNEYHLEINNIQIRENSQACCIECYVADGHKKVRMFH